MQMVQNLPVEKFQMVREDNLFKKPLISEKFQLGSQNMLVPFTFRMESTEIMKFNVK
jgi:hypothetical protein